MQKLISKHLHVYIHVKIMTWIRISQNCAVFSLPISGHTTLQYAVQVTNIITCTCIRLLYHMYIEKLSRQVRLTPPAFEYTQHTWVHSCRVNNKCKSNQVYTCECSCSQKVLNEWSLSQLVKVQAVCFVKGELWMSPYTDHYGVHWIERTSEHEYSRSHVAYSFCHRDQL